MEVIKRHKWLIILGAVIVQISIGTIYSWSLFNFPLMDKFGWSENQVVFTYSIAIFMFAFSTIISGKLLDKLGPRFVATIGGILYGGGLILSSFSNSIIEIYLYYGVISGMGVGFVYVCPISTSVKWFPNKKGLITGIAVGAFGLGSLVFKFIIQSILDSNDILHTFAILGVIYMTLIILGAQLLLNPKYNTHKINVNDNANQNDVTVKQMLRHPFFYFSWVLFYIGTIGGLLVIGLALDIGVTYVGLTLEYAANTVAIIAFFNALGRIVWGSLADKIERVFIIVIILSITTISMFIMGFVNLNALTFFIVLSAIAFTFGGILSVFPILTGELFGKKNFGSNYGVMYQAYGLAALTGPLLLTLVHKLDQIFLILGTLSSIGIIISVILLKKVKVKI